MNSKQIETIFLEEGIDQEITCPKAMAIAEKHNITKKEIGDYCTAHKIKIRACQLGCFK